MREVPDRTVQLTMYRNVAGYTMVNALSTAIKPKMGGKDEKVLEEFEKVLTSGMHKHGSLYYYVQYCVYIVLYKL